MAKKENARQQQLFAETQSHYGWKSVKDLQRGETIVVMEQEIKVLGIKAEEDGWLVSYTDPTTGKKVEQLYNAIDSVYAKR